MARPFQTTFEQDSPSTPQSAISYQANVNRAKTKKWVEAKSVDYGGDDWGDDEQYEYDLPAPPPKPTGLRHQGQNLQSAGKQEASAVDNNRRYGDLPPLPGPSDSRPRANSFDADDEKRNFSSGAPRQPSPSIASPTAPVPATRFSQITGVPTVRNASGPPQLSISTQQPPQPAVGLRKPNPVVSPISGSPIPGRNDSGVVSPASDTKTTTPTPSSIHARRDYSPSAVPLPLSTRASPAPQSAPAEPSASKFPARKSSLSQIASPLSVSTILADEPTPKPWAAGQPASPGGTARSPTTPGGKPLPFIRPADIYRRVEEERERERQSMDSSRPSMDSILGSRASDKSDSPANTYLGEKSSSESLSGTGRRSRSNLDDEAPESSHQPRPTLEPVQERKSEYGFDSFNGEKLSESDRDQNHLDIEEARRQSTSPKLPDLARLSGFGLDMFSPTHQENTATSKNTDGGSNPATALQPSPSIHEASHVETDSLVVEPVRSVSVEGKASSISQELTASEVPVHATIPSDSEAVPPPVVVPEHRDAPQQDLGQEQNFRPLIPGGWTSYATTARSASPIKPNEEYSHPTVTEVSLAEARREEEDQEEDEEEEDDWDATPTSIKHSFPPSDTAAVTGVESAHHDNIGPGIAPRTHSPILAESKPQLPTPDPSMAPGGSLYSSSGLDPRYFPATVQAPPQTTLDAPIMEKSISAQSSTGPTPPPKDTPAVESPESAEYFPNPIVPLKQKAQEDVQRDLSPESYPRPGIVPTLSMDIRHDDEENDRLRKEIVKSLSPGLTDPAHGDLDQFSDDAYEPTSGDQGRESTYLPSEYDNYWATTAEESAPIPAVASPLPAPEEPPLPSLPTKPIAQTEGHTTPPIERSPLNHRFSWEQSSESVPIAQPSELAPQTPSHELQGDLPSELAQELDTVASKPLKAEPDSPTHYPASSMDHQVESSTLSSPNPSNEQHMMEGAGLLLGGTALVGAAAAVHANRSPGLAERRMSLAQEKEAGVSTYPVSPTPPEDEHPARSPQPYFSPSADESHQLQQSTSNISRVNSPETQQHAPAARPLTFKQIAAMNSQHERIRVYEQTRQHYASMNSGLNDWISALQNQYPEHSNVTSSYGGPRMSMPSVSTRSKFAKVTGAAPPPLQQPYYQQYLNASPSAPSTPVSRPGAGPSISSGSQQGFGSSSNKLSGHQVQAKGKELLHTAGIFGGKAGKAGKGLLAKGKNRLRGAGAGDKTSPQSKPKPDRRSSWGFPSLSRPTGRPDSSPHSINTNPQDLQAQRPRAATLTSLATPPSPQLPPIARDDWLSNTSGALRMQRSQSIPRDIQHTIRRVDSFSDGVPTHVTSLDESETQEDSLGIPAPIGKEQPTWDVENSGPIMEEEGAQIEMDQTPSARPPLSISGPGLLVAKAGIPPTSERSNSNDAPFFDAEEHLSNLGNDWVLVSPTVDVNPQDQVPENELLSKTPPTIVNNNPLSILNRPRGNYEVPPMQSNTSDSRNLHAPLNLPLEASVTMKPGNPILVPPPPPIPRDPEPSTSTSSFLPPIRRSSTFQLPFGTHHPRRRTHKEHDEALAINTTSNTAHKRQDSDGVSPIEETQSAPVVETRPGDFTQSRNTMSAQTPPARPLSFVRSGPLQDAALSTESHVPNSPHSPHIGYQEASQEHTHQRSISEQSTATSHGHPPSSIFARPAVVQTEPEINSQPIPATPEPPEVSHYSQNVEESQVEWRENQPTTDPEKTPLIIPALIQPQARPEEFEVSQIEWRQDQRTPDPEPPISQAPKATQVQSRPDNIEESQVEWRHDDPRPTPPPAVTSPSYWKAREISPPREPSRESIEYTRGRGRGYSGSHQNYGPRSQEPDFEKETGYAPIEHQRPFVQPPSSAQRYPGLFRPGQQGPNTYQDYGPPSQQPQSAVPRSAFNTNPQSIEFQGPSPHDDPRLTANKRNSGLWQDLSAKFARGTSRERANSYSRDGGLISPPRPLESRGDDYGAPSVASDLTQETKTRRTNFFGPHRGSTAGLDTPVSRESVIAHPAGSRLDLASSMPPPAAPVTVKQDRKRSFFGNHPSEPKPKGNRLFRASTGNVLEDTGKKKRFSGLSGFFGKSSQSVASGSVDERPQATRELSHHERQPIESPRLNYAQTSRFAPPEKSRTPVSIKHTFTRSSTPRQDSKPRRPSASTLLSGLIGRRSHQQERGSDESHSQGSSQPYNGNGPQILPPAMTYSDLQEERSTPSPRPQIRERHLQERGVPPPSLPHPERGRRPSREPQYDHVPIPGGYSLVRGDGSVPVPTQYDPRGLNRNQQYHDSRIASSQLQSQLPPAHNHLLEPQTVVPGQTVRQQYQHDAPMHLSNSQSRSPQLISPPSTTTTPRLTPPPESYQQPSTSRRLSRDDVLARSPPRPPQGQQRPYQLSLPTTSQPHNTPSPTSQPRHQASQASSTRAGAKSSPSPSTITTASSNRQGSNKSKDPIQRLQYPHPTIRHPESPAGYPLPDDDVFSPINEAAQDIPPPPPPKWPAHLDGFHSNQHPGQHHNGKGPNHTYKDSLTSSLSISNDLDRSNTRRTAVSAISNMSGTVEGGSPIEDHQHHLSLHRPSKPDTLIVPGSVLKENTNWNNRRTLSPTPPSGESGSPERGRSGSRSRSSERGSRMKTTDIILPEGPKEDLYNASPRLPKIQTLAPPPPALERMGSNSDAPVKGEGKGMVREEQEEKIVLSDMNHNHPMSLTGAPVEEEEGLSMSATSYPGQEWNPYVGGWDEDD